MWAKIVLVLFLIAILNFVKCLKVVKSNKGIGNESSQPPIETSLATDAAAPLSTLTTTSRSTSKIMRWKSLYNDGSSTVSDESSEIINNVPVVNNNNSTTKKSPSITAITWAPEDPTHKPTPSVHIPEQPFSPKNETSMLKEDVCEHFKYGATKFDYNKMADVWQTMYYQLPEKVQCFKIHIKKISEDEKRKYAKKYGNFSGIVDWNECNLEIIAASQMGRKHFLQGINEDLGVMDNIIIEEKESELPTVREESADQWLVAHNMLLMRDCDIGGVVVFSKVPYSPRLEDIENALKDFKEELSNGKMACDDEEVVNRSFEDDELD